MLVDQRTTKMRRQTMVRGTSGETGHGRGVSVDFDTSFRQRTRRMRLCTISFVAGVLLFF